MKNQFFWLWTIIFITTVSVLMVLPRFRINVDQHIGSIPIKIDQEVGGYDLRFDAFGFSFQRDLRFAPGLDLQGGVRAVLQADMSEIEDPELYEEALRSTKQVIENRIDGLGVVEPNIYTSVEGEEYRVVVELPGVTDTNEVISLIGETAQLEFREIIDDENVEPSPDNPQLQQPNWQPTELTGKYLERAQVVFDPSTGQPAVSIDFNDEGAELFEEITRRNIDKQLAIFLDENIVTAPTVERAIPGGQAIISGPQISVDVANSLAVQLNAGALPVSVEIVQQQNIGPTLGQETVQKSIVAGAVGLLMVAVFMVINYGWLGAISVASLVIYSLATLAIYKFIPVTLTLSGIAGFILSIGLAVDANILIFERIREEVRSGKDRRSAVHIGFTRAWSSIRDANTASLITVFILFNPFDWGFLVTSGSVRGFAVTLGIGVILALFTGVLVTKTLVYTFYNLDGGSTKHD